MRMRAFIVFEPRTVRELSEAVEFTGSEELAMDAKQAACYYAEKRPKLWGRTTDLWVLDKLVHPNVGTNTYTVRVNTQGEVEFY